MTFHSSLLSCRADERPSLSLFDQYFCRMALTMRSFSMELMISGFAAFQDGPFGELFETKF